MSDDGTFTWKARTRGCQCCKWKDQRIAELEAANKALHQHSAMLESRCNFWADPFNTKVSDE